MNVTSRCAPLFFIATSLLLTSCDKLNSTLKQEKELNARMQALLAEQRDLDAQLTALKANIPTNVIYLQSATVVAEKAVKDLEFYQEQLESAIKGFESTEKELADIEKELEVLRKL